MKSMKDIKDRIKPGDVLVWSKSSMTEAGGIHPGDEILIIDLKYSEINRFQRLVIVFNVIKYPEYGEFSTQLDWNNITNQTFTIPPFLIPGHRPRNRIERRIRDITHRLIYHKE